MFGGNETAIPVDFKRGGATHQGIRKTVEAGEFREDELRRACKESPINPTKIEHILIVLCFRREGVSAW